MRDLQPNSFVEELGEGLRELEGSRTPEKDAQSRLTWAQGLKETEPPTKDQAPACK